jgi:antitoxin ParD1/3/4
MNVSLTPELARQVEERVATGLYTSASEVVREALRLFLQFESARTKGLDELGGMIAAGLDQAAEGQVIAGGEAAYPGLLAAVLLRQDKRAGVV